jgi:fatty acid desaturase
MTATDAHCASPTDRDIPTATNMAIAGGLVLSQAWLWVLLPVYLLPSDARWGWTLVPVVLTTTTYWALLHEAFHDILLPDRRAGAALGRLLAILFGASFRVLRFGHLMHHRFNRTALDSPDLAGTATRRRAGTWIAYYFRLAFGLFLAEAAGGWLALLPRPAVEQVVRLLFGATDEAGRSMHGSARRQLLAPAALREIRTDAALALALAVTGFALYGAYWPMLVAALLARGFMLSFFDNAYHYGTAPGDVLSAMNLALPRWAERVILNFNLHGVHHRAPSAPWRTLPAAFRDAGAIYDANYFGAALRQVRGPALPPQPQAARVQHSLTRM